jgi:hypothetical protein
MNPITTTQRASKAASRHPQMIGAVRHTKRSGLMMANLGSRKQVLRQPR